MRLIDAYNLLVEDGISDNQRYFSEIYKHFRFSDEQLLKEYLDFIDAEPVEWMRGFPAKLNSKQTFPKPKTAVVKLLKKDAIKQALGVQYVERVYDKIWQTYKKEGEKIMGERSQRSAQSAQPTISSFLSQDDNEDAESYQSLPLPVIRSTTSHRPIAMNILHSDDADGIDHETVPIVAQGADRVELLKQVIGCLIGSLDPHVAEAFRLLLAEI